MWAPTPTQQCHTVCVRSHDDHGDMRLEQPKRKSKLPHHVMLHQHRWQRAGEVLVSHTGGQVGVPAFTGRYIGPESVNQHTTSTIAITQERSS